MHHHGATPSTSFIVWEGVDAPRLEAAEVEVGDDGLRARGTQIGAGEQPYRVRYDLDAGGPGFVTRSLTLDSAGPGWERRLRLERADSGEWTAEVGGSGDAVPAPGGDTGGFGEAMDCDIAFSPLTNTMPVLRHRLNEAPGTETFAMAWVSLPELSVHLSRQHYTHVSSDDDGSIVRFETEDRDFAADLRFRADGLVIDYPQLGRVPPDALRGLTSG